jgi:hypothetical protein
MKTKKKIGFAVLGCAFIGLNYFLISKQDLLFCFIYWTFILALYSFVSLLKWLFD